MVGAVADGREAVAVVRATRPDVLLLDLRMPGGDGLEAIGALCDDPVRVLVLSTFATGRDVRAAVEAGATGDVLADTRPTSSSPRCGPLRAAAAGELGATDRAAAVAVAYERGILP